MHTWSMECPYIDLLCVSSLCVSSTSDNCVFRRKLLHPVPAWLTPFDGEVPTMLGFDAYPIGSTVPFLPAAKRSCSCCRMLDAQVTALGQSAAGHGRATDQDFIPSARLLLARPTIERDCPAARRKMSGGQLGSSGASKHNVAAGAIAEPPLVQL